MILLIVSNACMLTTTILIEKCYKNVSCCDGYGLLVLNTNTLFS